MSVRRGALVAAGLAAAVALGPSAAAAYCLTSACGEETSHTQCVPAHEDDCGEPLRWHTRCTGFALQEDGSERISANRTHDILRAAFDTWMSADCGEGRHPGIVVQDLGRVRCGELEYNPDAGNANIVVYREKTWPHPPSTIHNIALTTTTFDPDTGELFDADIELNAANPEFVLTTSDENPSYDLESVLVHETGHFLGLGHSDAAEATMLAFYLEGDTSLRTLDADDVAAICDLYPPKSGVDETCNPLPAHGFSPDCAASQVEGDCALRRAPARGGGALALAVVCVGLGAAWRRSRRAPP